MKKNNEILNQVQDDKNFGSHCKVQDENITMKNLTEIVDKKLNEFMVVQYPENIFKSMKYTVLLPGKRLRPVMCLESCRMFGEDFEKALPTACAIEMLHAQTLIHDDLPCMDNDDFRRGKPSNHKVFGEAIAVLAGDALLSFAPQIITKHSKFGSEKLVKVLNEFFRAAGAYGVIAGQVIDIESEKFETTYTRPEIKNFDPPLKGWYDEEQFPEILEYIHTHKTADLFKLALRTGAIIADATEEQIELITEFGQKLGVAFQIADDILDETSTFEEMGKTLGKDKDAGKLTYTNLYGLKHSKATLNKLLDECKALLEKNGLTSDIFNQIIEKIRIK